MFTRPQLLRAVVVTGLTGAVALSLAPVAMSRPTTHAAVEQAVTALTSQSTQAAEQALPPDFTTHFGYRPEVVGGMLGDPSGGCSSPVPLPAEFEDACRQHDLGYDLIRYAGRSGHALPASARRAVDDRLSVELEDSCDVRSGDLSRASCVAWADIATGFVRVNSMRQGYGPPEAETPLTIAPAVALGVAGLGGVGLVIHRRRRKTLRDNESGGTSLTGGSR